MLFRSFPAMLKEHGEFGLPENVPANEFLNLEGDKISTSRNWAVWLNEYLDEFPQKQDVLRYVLCATAPENKDNDFTWKDFQARNNSELVAILGNFINRTLVLTQKFYYGKVPQHGEPNEADKAVIKEMKETPKRIGELIEKYRFRDALFELMNLARTGNKYLADNEPWKTIKTDKQRTATVMYISLEITACLAYLMEPFIPFSSQKILKMLNLEKKKWSEVLGKQILKPGHQLGEPALLFDKIEDDIIEKQIQKLKATKMESTAASANADKQEASFKASTTFDDFSKMDIRVGTILEAKRVPKTDKLLKLLVDTGLDKRTVVSGIANYYEPEKIIGQQVSILVNLEPRKIKGIESQGMILMAENANGELAFVAPTKQIDNGGTVK